MILPGTRIRDNGVFGTILDAPLTAGATTFNSAELAGLSTVAGNHALVTLDPLKEFGLPEIVMVTAHTAAAPVASITRGMFGTTARSHPLGTLWVHAACDNDFIEILTSGTRPADQYEGQFIFETDTNKLVGFGGVDWAPRDAGGQLGYAQTTVNQGAIGAANVDLTNLTTTVTVATGRRVKISATALMANDTATFGGAIQILQDGAVIGQGATYCPVAAAGSQAVADAVVTPSAGLHTYKLQGVRLVGGTVTLQASAYIPSFILVEDIGAA